jgi:hypothetical protein
METAPQAGTDLEQRLGSAGQGRQIDQHGDDIDANEGEALHASTSTGVHSIRRTRKQSDGVGGHLHGKERHEAVPVLCRRQSLYRKRPKKGPTWRQDILLRPSDLGTLN